jgi:hypothetical protein
MSKRQGNTINMSNLQIPKNKLSKEMEEELRKQGIDPDIINEYGDVDWEDNVDEYFDYKDNHSEYGDDSHLED